jgi:hypothetical protein
MLDWFLNLSMSCHGSMTATTVRAAEHTSLRSILRLELTPFCPILRRSRVDKWAALDAACLLFFELIAE